MKHPARLSVMGDSTPLADDRFAGNRLIVALKRPSRPWFKAAEDLNVSKLCTNDCNNEDELSSSSRQRECNQNIPEQHVVPSLTIENLPKEEGQLYR